MAAGQTRNQDEAKWREGAEARFLDALATSCNVRLSARRAGVSASAAYARRRIDAAFRDGWAKAIAQGYARLEIETLERALNGTRRTIEHRDGRSEERFDYDARTALTLLKMHRDTAEIPARRERQDTQMSEEEIEELRRKIVEKLERLREQTSPDGTELDA